MQLNLLQKENYVKMVKIVIFQFSSQLRNYNYLNKVIVSNNE